MQDMNGQKIEETGIAVVTQTPLLRVAKNIISNRKHTIPASVDENTGRGKNSERRGGVNCFLQSPAIILA